MPRTGLITVFFTAILVTIIMLVVLVWWWLLNGSLLIEVRIPVIGVPS